MKEFCFTDKARNQPSSLEWTVKVIERGDTYGKDGCLKHDQFAESRHYRERWGGDGENEDLFPPNVVDWIVDSLDEIMMLECEISESEKEFD